MTETLSLFPVFIGLVVSASVAWGLVFTKKWHGRFSLDYDVGVQKVHTSPTPRVGGIALAAGGVAGWMVYPSSLWSLILLALIPAFSAGLLEDITGAVRPRWRLLATAIGGGIFFLTTGYGIDRLGFGPLDIIGEMPWVMGALTIFAFAATANATNLVDGFNGLAGSTILLMSLGLAGIAVQVGDVEIAQLCFLTAGVVVGFLLANYPWGKIIMGDGGAYTLGSLLAALGIALIYRNPDISPRALLVCFSYPAIETAFSIWRRRKRKKDISSPDRVHFHQLVWRAFARPIAKRLGRPELANPLTLYFIWPLAMFGPLMSAIFYYRTLAALLGLVCVLIVYLGIYRVVSLSYIHKRRIKARIRAKNEAK